MSDVVNLCATLNVKTTAGPLGVSFSWYFEGLLRTGRAEFRIERGSGIAGRGDAWNVRELPSDPPIGPKVTTRRELRRQILEAIAEPPKPEPRPELEIYARWHTYGTTSSVQWFTRRRPMRRPA